MEAFPPELIIEIMRYLPFRDLIRCHRVSRSWRTILASEPSLYRQVDLRAVCQPLSSLHINALARYAAGNIRDLRLSSVMQTFTEAISLQIEAGTPGFKSHRGIVLKPLFENLQVFEHRNDVIQHRCLWFGLAFFPPRTLQKLHLCQMLDLSQVERLLQEAPTLECLHCWIYQRTTMDIGEPRYPNLKTLSVVVQSSREVGGFQLDRFLARFPEVEEFQMDEASIDIRHSIDLNFLLPKLKILRIFNRVSMIQVGSKYLHTIEIQTAIQLRTLNLSSDASFVEVTLNGLRHPDLLEQFRRHASALQKLSLQSAFLEVRDVSPFLLNGGSLRYISLSQVRYVNDSTLEMLSHCKFLERLDIDHCPGATGSGIIKLVERLSVKIGGKLSIVSARGNESLRRQTLDWASRMGVKILI